MTGETYRYSVTVNDGPIDFGLCAMTGQMFRWTLREDGSVVGWDGGDFYEVRSSAAGIAPLAGRRATGMNRDPARDARTAVVRTEGEGETVTLNVVASAPKDAFQRLLRLDTDFRATRAEIVRRGPEMASYLAATEGLRLLRPAGRVESIFSFICSANNNVPRIATMVERLAGGGGFPRIETLAGMDEAVLRADRFGYRARSVIETAMEIAGRGGETYLDRLDTVPTDELVLELQGWRGVGPKVADCIALFAFDRTEVAPIDTHLWQALRRLYPDQETEPFTTAKAKRLGRFFQDRFGPTTAWAQQALFYENLLNWRARGKNSLPTITTGTT